MIILRTAPPARLSRRGTLTSCGSDNYALTAENCLAVGGVYYFDSDPLQRLRLVHLPDWSTYRQLNYDGDDLIFEYDRNTISRR